MKYWPSTVLKVKSSLDEFSILINFDHNDGFHSLSVRNNGSHLLKLVLGVRCIKYLLSYWFRFFTVGKVKALIQDKWLLAKHLVVFVIHLYFWKTHVALKLVCPEIFFKLGYFQIFKTFFQMGLKITVFPDYCLIGSINTIYTLKA